MSAVIKTTTPFIIKSVLFKALEAVGSEPKILTSDLASALRKGRTLAGDILTNRSDYNGCQFFHKQGERWVFLHDSDEYSARIESQLSDRKYIPVSQFLTVLSHAYDTAYQEHVEAVAEQERIRLESERKARVESTRQNAIAKAKAHGYSVKQSETATGQIQLVLTRTV
ncbi:hypothetical protein [Marinomonas flavescens]|uniref:hypothetical protein n=1 Tax=Marinomonas flavescens TaxID=2529379 RepID=UPI00105545B9|nr:hypothetical protein [Marinomonas flavescens]